jgi:VCBS repeat-containing protein
MRRFPLPALYAGIAGAVLLVGCQSAVEPTSSGQPRPSVPSVSFEIAGPSQIDAGGSYTWVAYAFGGSGAYQYQWEVTRHAGQQLTTGTERSLSLHVLETDGDLVLRLTVTSDNQSRVRSLAVRNCIGGCKF